MPSTNEATLKMADELLNLATAAVNFPISLRFTKVDTTAATAARERALNLKTEIEGLSGQRLSDSDSSLDQALQQFTERLNALAADLAPIWSDHVESAKHNDSEAIDCYKCADLYIETAQDSCGQLQEVIHRLDTFQTKEGDAPEFLSLTVKLNPRVAEAFDRSCKKEESSPDREAAAAILAYIESGDRYRAEQRLDEVERGRKACLPFEGVPKPAQWNPPENGVGVHQPS